MPALSHHRRAALAVLSLALAAGSCGCNWSPREAAGQLACCMLVPAAIAVIALASLSGPIRRYSKRLAARQRSAENRCVKCGYDLRATPERCPECGTVAAAVS
jgi:hypothetical protein